MLDETYYELYCNLIKTNDENAYIESLKNMTGENDNLQHFKEIKHIRKLMPHLQKLNYLLAYKVTLYLYLKSELIHKIAVYFIFTNITKLIEQLHSYKKYMNAYTTINIYNSDESMNNDKWIHHTKYELLNRLVLLSQYFGVSQLIRFKITIKKYNDIEKKSFAKVAKYYNSCVNKINKSIKKTMKLGVIYIEITIACVLTVIMHNENVNMENYYVWES